MKEIPLSKGKVALVDDEDYERLSQFKWCASQQGRNGLKWYAIRWVCPKGEKQYKVAMHRFILGIAPRIKDDPRVVDHIDCDGLNNQKSNLQIMDSNHQNMLKEKGWKKKKEVECFL